MNIEFVTLIDDYDYSARHKRILSLIRDSLRCKICYEKHNTKLLKAKKHDIFESQTMWAL